MELLIPNGIMQTTAALVAVTTGTAIKTMLQIKPLVPLWITEWGISFDGFAAALPGKVELIETDINATVTASAEADITKLSPVADAAAMAAAFMTLSSSGTGYTSTDEDGAGSITAVRNLDGPQFIAPTSQYSKQFPLGFRPMIQVAKWARIRVTFGTAVNCYCFIKVSPVNG